jgi:hypothetical protein
LAREANAPDEALTKFGTWMNPVFRSGSFTVYQQP